MGKSLKGKELGRGISQRTDGRYQARFTNRFGKRQIIYSHTYTGIIKAMRDAVVADETQKNVVRKDVVLDDWYEIWKSTCKVHCRNTTLRTYQIQYNQLKEELGHRKLTSLNLIILQQAFNKLSSDASRRHCKALLVDILNRAMESDLIVKNCALSVRTDIDNEVSNEKRILTDDEIKLLYEVSKDGYIYPIFVVALNTGMRIGELLGLTWECIDFDNGIIRVNRTLCYLPNKGIAIYEFHQPKTKAGMRGIPMTKECQQALLDQKIRMEKVNKKYPPKEGFEDLVFTSKTNHPLHESNVRATIRYMVQKINALYPDIEYAPFTAHGLRHTFATNCIEKGMRPKTLQKILGHNSLQMTMDLYCHVHESTLREEMALVSEVV